MNPAQQGAPEALATRSVVLVVEDESLLALDLEQVLNEAGHEVVLATDGPGALARSTEPELCVKAAVVDLHLAGGMNGYEVIRRLRARSPRLPVVVVTGYSPLAPQADLRGLGGPTVRLQKPVHPGLLLRHLGDAMASDSGIG